MITEEKFNEALQWYRDHTHPADRERSEKATRDDIKLRPLAIELGYTVEYGNNFGSALKFNKGNKTIWSCPHVQNSGTQNFKIVERFGCQELIDNRWCNNRYYIGLEVALRAEC